MFKVHVEFITYQVRLKHFEQGWGAGAGRSRVFLAPWETIRSRSRLKKKSGAGAAKKFAGSPALDYSYFSRPLVYSN